MNPISFFFAHRRHGTTTAYYPLSPPFRPTPIFAGTPPPRELFILKPTPLGRVDELGFEDLARRFAL